MKKKLYATTNKRNKVKKILNKIKNGKKQRNK